MRRSRPSTTAWRWAGFAASLVGLHLALGASPYPPALIPTLMRVPLELAVLLALATFSPEPLRRPVRWIALGFLVVLLPLKLLDAGFYVAFDRPFDPVLDFYLLPDGWTLLKGAVGLPRASIALAGAVVVLIAAVVGLYWALRGLEALRTRPQDRLVGGALAAGLAALSLVPLGYKVGLPGPPAIVLAADHVATSARNLKDVGVFRHELKSDPYAGIAHDRLLSALKGKDVMLVFVESYGRGAIEDPRYAPKINARLASIQAEIAKSGFQARSAWMRSPTHGGQSWLAHETLLSGLWINGGSRYQQLINSTHPTLIHDFKRGGWRTVAVAPAISAPWPEASFFGYDKIYAAKDLDYRGLPFNWMTMPDQFTLLRLNQKELSRTDRPPLMAEITLISSHAPFTPVPPLLDWTAIGDGQVYNPTVKAADPPEKVWLDKDRVRAEYAASIDYSLASLGAFARDFGDDRLVIIMLGDHQPGGELTRPQDPHEVPVHILAKDPKVLQAIDGWGWASGMRPDAKGPVWPMDQFRGRLVDSFTPDAR